MMNETSLVDLFRTYTIKQLISLIDQSQLSERDLFDCCEHRFETFNPYLKAFKCVFTKYEATHIRDGSFPLANQPLRSIPFGIKDVFNTCLKPTEMGSIIWEGFEAGNNARCVDSLLRSGAIPFGKTVTAEFAVHALNETLNPYDPARTPGTSSSGSAVAVAAGIVPFSIGTQTAASIIRPASFCGVWGMKPSFGLIPRTGSLKTTDTLDTIGFFSYFGSDLRRILSSMRVKGPNYPYVYRYVDKAGPYPKPHGSLWKVGFFKSCFWEIAQPAIKRAIEKVVAQLQAIPNIEIEVVPDFCGTNIHELHELIYAKCLSYYFTQESLSEDRVSSLMLEAIKRGSEISVNDFQAALDSQSTYVEKCHDTFDDIDVIISLSTSTVAPIRNQTESPDPSLIWTFLGMPSLNVPIGFSDEGLPISLQLSARKYNDYLLLQFLDHALSLEIFRNQSIELPTIGIPVSLT